MTNQLSTPVVLIGFNRPDLVRRSLAAVRAVRPARLFVICDGPRASRLDDVSEVAEVRRIFREIDWPCTLSQRFSDRNLGCEASVETGLDWVFSQVDRAIILEDDCVADRSFFQYAEELLDRYDDDDRVWHIAGNRHGVSPRLFGEDSYRFSTWASVWGWATWADRWQHHRLLFPRDHQQRDSKGFADVPVRLRPATPRQGALVTRSARQHFAEAATSSDVVTHGWDKHWWLTIIAAGGLSATPSANLVANVGFGADATHGTGERPDEIVESLALPLRHPAAVVLDTEVERDLELRLGRVGGKLARSVRTAVRSPRLRGTLRRLVDSPAAVSTARLVSRIANRRR